MRTIEDCSQVDTRAWTPRGELAEEKCLSKVVQEKEEEEGKEEGDEEEGYLAARFGRQEVLVEGEGRAPIPAVSYSRTIRGPRQ